MEAFSAQVEHNTLKSSSTWAPLQLEKLTGRYAHILNIRQPMSWLANARRTSQLFATKNRTCADKDNITSAYSKRAFEQGKQLLNGTKGSGCGASGSSWR
jgi:hypothetical protein